MLLFCISFTFIVIASPSAKGRGNLFIIYLTPWPLLLSRGFVSEVWFQPHFWYNCQFCIKSLREGYYGRCLSIHHHFTSITGNGAIHYFVAITSRTTKATKEAIAMIAGNVLPFPLEDDATLPNNLLTPRQITDQPIKVYHLARSMTMPPPMKRNSVERSCTYCLN